MSARALPKGWELVEPSRKTLFINTDLVARIEGGRIMWKQNLPEKVEDYIVLRLKEDEQHRYQKVLAHEQKRAKRVIDSVLSEMKAEESC